MNSFSIQYAKQWFRNASGHIIRLKLNELVERGALVSEGRTRKKSISNNGEQEYEVKGYDIWVICRCVTNDKISLPSILLIGTFHDGLVILMFEFLSIPFINVRIITPFLLLGYLLPALNNYSG